MQAKTVLFFAVLVQLGALAWYAATGISTGVGGGGESQAPELAAVKHYFDQDKSRAPVINESSKIAASDVVHKSSPPLTKKTKSVLVDGADLHHPPQPPPTKHVAQDKAPLVASANTSSSDMIMPSLPDSKRTKTMLVGGGESQHSPQPSPKQVIAQNKPLIVTSANASTKVATTDTIIRIPSVPDPNVWSRVSMAWTNDNGTTRLNLVESDKHLVNILTRKCSVTSQFELSTTESKEKWILYSLTDKGKRKSVGGDEMYIKYHASGDTNLASPDTRRRHPTAVAKIKDRKDGSYELEFVESPHTSYTNTTQMIGGKIEIELEYTCGLGMLKHGTKLLWNSPGCVLLKYSTPVSVAPSIRPFRRPTANVDLSVYDKVLVYGDSNLQYMVISLSRLDCCPNLQFTVKPEVALNDKSIHRKFIKHSRQYLNETLAAGYSKIALVIGSNVWDIVFGVRHGSDFKSHKEGCKILMKTLQKDFPLVDFYWYSGVMLHIQVMRESPEWHKVVPLKYMSRSRSLQLYKWQKSIMESMNIKLIDVFEASQLSGELMEPFDARHYSPIFWNSVIPWFYKNASAS